MFEVEIENNYMSVQGYIQGVKPNGFGVLLHSLGWHCLHFVMHIGIIALLY